MIIINQNITAAYHDCRYNKVLTFVFRYCRLLKGKTFVYCLFPFLFCSEHSKIRKGTMQYFVSNP